MPAPAPLGRLAHLLADLVRRRGVRSASFDLGPDGFVIVAVDRERARVLEAALAAVDNGEALDLVSDALRRQNALLRQQLDAALGHAPTVEA